jgi:hypothetical protein
LNMTLRRVYQKVVFQWFTGHFRKGNTSKLPLKTLGIQRGSFGSEHREITAASPDNSIVGASSFSNFSKSPSFATYCFTRCSFGLYSINRCGNLFFTHFFRKLERDDPSSGPPILNISIS